MLLNLLSGLVQGYDNEVKNQEQRFLGNELKKSQIKAFKMKLDREEQEKQAMTGLLAQFAPLLSTQTDDLGVGVEQPAPKPRTLQQRFAEPQTQALALQAGYKLGDIRQLQQPSLEESLPAIIAKMQTANASGGGGMEFTGLKIGPNGQHMADFSKPKFKSEVPGPGNTLIQYDEYGRQMGTRPAALKETETPAYIAAKKSAEESVSAVFDKEKARPKAQLALTNAKQRTDRVSKTIDEAIPMVDAFTAGPIGAATKLAPGTSSRDLEALLSTIKANIGFDELNAMRQSSPTGGALGQVSERELGFLQSVLSNLEQSQSPKQLRKNLIEAKSEIQNSWKRINEAYELDFGKSKEKPSLKGPGKSSQGKTIDFNSLPK